MSGQHVVYGFLRPTAQWMVPKHNLTVLHYQGQPPPSDLLALGVSTIAISDRLRNWVKRTAWEAIQLPRLIRQHDFDCLLSVSGASTPNCPVPQVTLCMNPWCYVPTSHTNWRDRLKARLQRAGYRKAFRDAAMMIYISRHLRDLYRQDNVGHRETRSEIAYVGLNEATFQSARDLRCAEREPYSIISVSAMARWKGADTLVRATGQLHERGIPATLKLVGPWPDSSYEQEVRQLIDQLSLAQSVAILGRVSDDELHRLYASNQVFALMSSCESFGIPAAEAMAFGTPIVSTNRCAIAEVCEGAGQFGPVGDVQWTADALHRAMTDQSQWDQWSATAVQRASQLTWNTCAQPFRHIPELIESTPSQKCSAVHSVAN